MATGCACCGRNEAELLGHRPGADGRPYRILRCTGCGLWRVDPMPRREELAAWYGSRGHSERETGLVLGAPGPAVRAALEDRRQWLRLALRLAGSPHPQRALDVGCGFGFFLAALEERAIPAVGIDLDGHAVAHARQWFGVDARRGSLAEAAELPPVDLLSLWEVLEHQPDPTTFLREVRDRIAPGGHLVGSVPNAEGIAARLRGVRWRMVYPPDHLHYFGPGSLEEILRRTGFEPVFVGTVACMAAPNWSLGIRRAILHRTERLPSGWRAEVLRATHRGLTLAKRHVVYAALNRIIAGLGLGGDNLLFVARRPPEPALAASARATARA